MAIRQSGKHAIKWYLRAAAGAARRKDASAVASISRMRCSACCGGAVRGCSRVGVAGGYCRPLLRAGVAV
eukprot:2276206-Prymnesium_polylepis.2